MSLAPPESIGPLRRERLRTARLYFVCEALRRGEDPEALLRAALVCLVIPPLVFRPDGRGLHDVVVGSATVELETARQGG